MTAAGLLRRLDELQIDLYLDGEQLCFRAPHGVMSDELRNEIALSKAELGGLLRDATRLVGRHSRWVPSDDDLPMTPNQLWYLNTFEPERHTWAASLALSVPWSVSEQLLCATIEVLVQQHDVFRMRQYRTADGRWAQRIMPSEKTRKIGVHNMSGLSPEERTRAVHEVGHQLQSSLSSIHGPVIALALCRMEPHSDMVVLCLHKYVVDGYSINIVLDELWRIYEDLAQDRDARSHSECSTYRDYLFALHDYERRPMFVARALAFWSSPDHVQPTPALPVDMAGGRHTDINSRRISVLLEPELLRSAARFLGSQEGASFNNVLLFSLARAYFRWSGQRILRLDFEYHGRAAVLPQLDLMRTIGPTTIKFPIVLHSDAGADVRTAFSQLCSTVHDSVGNAFGYGYLRYKCADSSVGRELARCAPAQVFLNNRTTLSRFGAPSQPAPSAVPAPVVSAHALHFLEPKTQENPVSYDLMVECDDAGSAVLMSWVYSSAIYHESTIRELSQRSFYALGELADYGAR